MSTFFSRSISEQVNKWRSKNVSVKNACWFLEIFLLLSILFWCNKKLCRDRDCEIIFVDFENTIYSNVVLCIKLKLKMSISGNRCLHLIYNKSRYSLWLFDKFLVCSPFHVANTRNLTMYWIKYLAFSAAGQHFVYSIPWFVYLRGVFNTYAEQCNSS